MSSQSDFVKPPRLATWLVNLFTPAEDTESILGDLLEEYSDLVSKSGVGLARSWYWRQTAKTIANLFGTGFRAAPWSTTAAVVGGYLARSFLGGFPDKMLSAVTDRYLAFWSTHFQAYTWVLKGMTITHLILSMFVGCIVALAAKGREMIATVMLSLVGCAMVGVAYSVWVVQHWPMDLALWWLAWQCSGQLAILVGGAIVRTRRSTTRVRPSQA
jgi:hypothetical protein